MESVDLRVTQWQITKQASLITQYVTKIYFHPWPRRGSRGGGGGGNGWIFRTPFFWSPFFFFYLSNIEIIFDFSGIITRHFLLLKSRHAFQIIAQLYLGLKSRRMNICDKYSDNFICSIPALSVLFFIICCC